MATQSDPFETLGIAEDADPEEIKAAYRREAMRWHPDRSGDSAEAATRFHQVTEAYRRLTGRFTHHPDTITSGPKSAGKTAGNTSSKEDSAEAGDKRPFNRQCVKYFVGKYHHDPKNINFYYQEVFRDLNDRYNLGQFVSTLSNPYLNKLFRRSIYLLLVICAAVFYAPGAIFVLPIEESSLFQVPMMLLSLMLVWALYRKLWLLFFIGSLLMLATQFALLAFLPSFLAKGVVDTLLFFAALLLPALLISQYANRFYYAKAVHVIETTSNEYFQANERRQKLRRRGGTSSVAAGLGVALIASYFFAVIGSDRTDLSLEPSWLPGYEQTQGVQMSPQRKTAMQNMLRFFAAGEQAYQQGNHVQALNAYLKAADAGSLLANYKLGYMYLNGVGVDSNDRRALYYFHQVTETSLVAQPQDLFLVTRWLGQAYNNLGIMYLAGFGSGQNPAMAQQMFVKAREYGASSPTSQLGGKGLADLRQLIAKPDF